MTQDEIRAKIATVKAAHREAYDAERAAGDRLRELGSELQSLHKALAEAGPLTPADLIYASEARCPCGAGMAYQSGVIVEGAWDCSAILLGAAIPSGQPGAVEHNARLPFAFWSVQSEASAAARGRTTRPIAEAA